MNLLYQTAGRHSTTRKDRYEIGRYVDANFMDMDIVCFIKTHIHMRHKPHVYLPVETIDGCMLPTFDIDYDPMVASSANIRQYIMKQFDTEYFALIQSSPRGFWVVFDHPCMDIEDALNLRLEPPWNSFCDKKYVDCARQARRFVLRATPKDGFIPHVIKSNMVRQESIDWLNDFEAYWSSPEVQEYVDIQVMNAL